MILIGLTGSIGTGKTTVTSQFEGCGAATLDSDRVVHMLLEKGGAAVGPVAKLFPEAVDDGRIDRKKLGSEVFGNNKKLKALEVVIHPLVRSVQERFVKAARLKGVRLVVLDIPLLFETHGDRRCDVTVVTTAPYFIQQLRVLKRPNMTQEKFEQVLKAQMPDREKRKRADFIVETGNGKAASLKTVKRIIAHLSGHLKYERMDT